MNTLIIIILVVLFILTLFLNPVESFEKHHYDCIISINVHEKFNFLLKQLKNISENISCKHAIILNCNELMLNECKNNELPENVFYYEEPLEKNRYHGSIAHGIFRNMKYALDHFSFEYFIVASSRSLFDNNMKLDDLKKLHEATTVEKIPYDDEKYKDWYWPSLSKTLLGQYYKEQNLGLHSSAHEGVVYPESACRKIVAFLDSHPEIRDDAFDYGGSVEEFALQTIAVNEGEKFYYIGNGCCVEEPIRHLGPENPLFRYTYKTKREENTNRTSFIRCNNPTKK